MRPTTITVVAHPDRIVPIPSLVLRSPTGAQIQILGTGPASRLGRALHGHELTGAITLDLTSPEGAQYVRRALRSGDLERAPSPTSAPSSPTNSPAAPASTVTTAKG